MAKFRVPVTWMSSGEYEIEANTKEQAIAKALDLPLPDCPMYICGSFEIYEDEVEKII